MRVKLQMAKNNVGSLVVLKPGEQQYIAGIITERGKIIFKNLDQILWFNNNIKVNLILLFHWWWHNQADYLRKIIAQERSPNHTRVGEIMTNEVSLSLTYRLITLLGRLDQPFSF